MMKKTGPFTVKEFAKIKGKSERTIRRWAREFPEKYGLEVQKKERSGGGTGQLFICEIVNDSSDQKVMPQTPDDLSSYPLAMQLEILLHQKTIGKTVTQKTSMRKYYRDIFRKTSVIPKGLLSREGRKASGRKRVISPEIEKRFIEMVHKSAGDDVNSPDFITKNLRTIVNYHRRLEDEFKKTIPLDALYRLVKKHGLKKYIYKPDYGDADIKKMQYCFKSLPVFDLIQIDGCVLHYIQIKDKNDKWAHPRVIEYMDMGSRYMIFMDLYFSESNEDAIASLTGFLRSTEFPEKKINIRPDRAGGFWNFKRPIHELNRKYSLFPGNFFLNENFARAGKPKDKSQLESSHRRLHGFEDFIISKLCHDKLVERVSGVKIKIRSNKIETVTISRLDITLEELRNCGLIRQYRKEHNKRLRVFSESGRQEKWVPEEKFTTYLSNVETFKFKNEDIEDCMKYGFQKKKATVSPKGKIRFQKQDYQLVKGDIHGGKRHVPVKVSKYKNKLFIFECPDDGVCIGEAMLISEYKDTENVEKALEKKLKLNEFEQIIQYLQQHGMVIKKAQLARLMELHNQGLKPDTVAEIIQIHKNKYDNYVNNSKYSNLKVGIVLINLFFAHVAEYEIAAQKKEKPYFLE